MKFFGLKIDRRRFISLSSLAVTIPFVAKASGLSAAEKAEKSPLKQEAMNAFVPNDKNAELRQKNIKTIEKWLSFTGTSRHKNRLTVYTDNFMSGNPSVKDSSKQGAGGRAAIEAMAAEVEAHPEKETFQGWHFYNARIYAAVDDPNLFNVNCLGKGTVITSDHPEGIVYQNHYTHYFKMKDGLIQAWWETVIDTPGSGSKPPWEETDRVKPPMVTFCESEK